MNADHQHYHHDTSDYLDNDIFLDEHFDADSVFIDLEESQEERREKHGKPHMRDARKLVEDYLDRKRMQESALDPYDDIF